MLSLKTHKKHKQWSSQKTAYVVLNIIAWMIVIIWPILQGLQGGAKITDITISYFIVYCGLPVMFIVLFYFNFYYLFDRLWTQGHRDRVWFIIWNFIIILMISFGTYFWQDYFKSRLGIQYTHMSLPETIFRIGTVLVMTVALAITLKYTIRFHKAETDKVALEAERREAELKNLRSQLNPHFLFNALNNIYSLMVVNSDLAQKSLYDLSKILRYVLYDDDELQVPLAKELDFMRSYVDIMKLRLTKNVEFESEITDDDCGVMIAPLMFMSLVENAFKHGISPNEPSYIKIRIAMNESGGKHQVVCEVRNSYYPKTDSDRSGSGIGVENLRRRLSLLYPGRFTFEMNHDDKNFYTELKIIL